MAIDTDRLVQIANELQSLDQRRDKLLAELHRIAGGGAPAPLSWVSTKPAAAAAPRRRGPGRPPGSRNQAKVMVAPAKPLTPAPSRKRRKGLTTDVLGLLADGGAYTAGEIVGKLGLRPTKGKIASVSTTLVRLRKEGRVKRDKVRGYRAA
jgi:hypothetical protein